MPESGGCILKSIRYLTDGESNWCARRCSTASSVHSDVTTDTSIHIGHSARNDSVCRLDNSVTEEQSCVCHFDVERRSSPDVISPPPPNRTSWCRSWGSLVRAAVPGRAKGTYEVYLITTLLPGLPDVALVNFMLPKELLLRSVIAVTFFYTAVIPTQPFISTAKVCRHWNALALDGSNWQRVDLFQFQKDVKGPVVENLAKRCGGFLKTLSLLGCENVQDGAVHAFATRCHNIEELNLHKCKRITDAACESLGKNCSKLLSLNLDCCSAITEKGIKAIAGGCPQLEYVNISWCTNILDDGVEALAKKCTQLKTLIAKGCTGLSDDGLSHIANGCPELRVVDLHSCSLTDTTPIQLASNCHQLEFISMSNCSLITDRALMAISKGCHNLKVLEVADCTQLSDGGFQQLAKNCHELEMMDMENCNLVTDNTMAHLATGCPNVKQLSLSHCELVTDEGIRQLSLSLHAHERLVQLELDNCPLISDVSLEHLRECRQLRKVDLYDCVLITRGGIRRLRAYLPEVQVHAYFAPSTPPANHPPRRHGFCRCCVIV